MSTEKLSLCCQVCDKKFNKKFHLSRHLVNVHKSTLTSNVARRLVCPTCQEKFFRHFQFIRHLKKVHSFDLPVEEYTFSSEEDFLNWRYNLQKKSLVEYTKECATRTLADGSRKVYLTCHRLCRPNQPLKKPEDRKRKLKSQGSKKKTESCPSRIEVVYSKDLISVKYWTTHFGHLNDLDHCSLDKSTRDNIARRLRNGDSFQQILDDVKTEETDNPRALLLDRRDLHNIIRDYNIIYNTNHDREVGISMLGMPEVNFEEVENYVNVLKAPTNVTTDLGSLQNLAEKASLILDLVNRTDSISDQDFKLVDEKLESAISILKTLTSTRNKFKCKTKCKRKDYTLSQTVFFGKKGKTLEKHKNPTFNASVNTIQGLKIDTQVIRSIQTENDHTYCVIDK